MKLFFSLLLIGVFNSSMAQQARPSILVICADDLSANSVSMNNPDAILQTPNINRIGQEGLNVTKYYSTNSICVPGRATLLSGKYGHTTGAYNNNANLPNSVKTIPKILHDEGYYTALCGKWMVGSSTPKPEFDYWLWTPGKSTYIDDTCKYFNTEFVATGHITDMLTDSVLALIARIDTPFLIYLNHNAPHAPYVPQPQFNGMFDTLNFPVPVNYNAYTQNYPSVVYDDSAFYIDTQTQFQNLNRNYFELIAGLDESTGKILDSLESLGRLENTIVVFTTDNGYMIGPHQLKGKEYPYEETIKMSMLMRYPAWFSPGSVIDSSFVLNTDFAPTLLEAAGIPDTFDMEGKSMNTIFNNQFYRDKFLYEVIPPVSNNIPQVRSVRDNYFLYSRYYAIDTTEELFDMVVDPYQMNNLVNNCLYHDTLLHYRIVLDSMRIEAGDLQTIIDNADCTLLNPQIISCCITVNHNLLVNICAGDSFYFNNVFLFSSGNFTDTVNTLSGCDSIVHLQLHVLPQITTILNIGMCPSETYYFNGLPVTTTGTYTVSYYTPTACDSTVILNLTVASIIETNPVVQICAGSSYYFNGSNLYTPGIYSATFIATGGCDSIVHLTLELLSVYNVNSSATICSNENYNFNGTILTAPGNYTSVFTSSGGCDSTVHLLLTVLPATDDSISAIICSGDSYNFHGTILTNAGNYFSVLTNSIGCDSIVYLQLEVMIPSTSSGSANICYGDTYNFNGTILNAPGIYNTVFQNMFGCDSAVQLTLTILPLNSDTTSVTICSGDTYYFNGNTYGNSGIYSASFIGADGCDSIAALSLNVLSPIIHNLNVSLCTGLSYTFDGNILSVSGNYSAIFNSALGCDSTVNLNLQFTNQINTTLAETICDGSLYNFNGTILNAAGQFTDTLTALGGCDSVVTLNLNVNFPVNTTNDEWICYGNQFNFNGTLLNVSGNYSDTLLSVTGCDSISHLNLTVLPEISDSFEVFICAGSTYNFNGTILSASGNYSSVLSASNGCDSSIHLSLFVVLGDTGNIFSEICNGDTYNFFGTPLNSTGNYFHAIPTGGSCDSVVHLSLNVMSAISYSYNDTICNGETYNFNGNILSNDGTYTSVIPASNFCDSTIHLQLEVIQLSAFIQQSGDSLFTTGNGMIQWMNCNTDTIIPGAIDTLFVPQFTGNYAAIITNGDCVDTTQCRHVTVTGLIELNKSEMQFALYPNPTLDNATMILKQPCEKCLVEITNTLGQKLFTSALNHPTEIINLSGYAAGIYFVKVYSPNWSAMRKLVKQ